MKYIDIHPILVDVFMKKMPKEILDIEDFIAELVVYNLDKNLNLEL